MADRITLDFLAKQQAKLAEVMASMRDDMRVMMAMLRRIDGTLTGLVNEVRAEHARYERHDRRLRKLEGAPS